MDEIIKECIEIAENLNKKIIQKKSLNEVKQIDLTDKKIVNNLSDIEERFDDHLDMLGKPVTIPVKQIIKLNNQDQMSHLMKHCVVAVMPKLSGEDENIAYIGAHNICTWSLRRHGHVTSSGTLTAKGRAREVYHASQCPDRSKKDNLYDKIYHKVFSVLLTKKSAEKKPTLKKEIENLTSAVKDVYYSLLGNTKQIVSDSSQLTSEEEAAAYKIVDTINRLEKSVDELYSQVEMAASA